MTDPADPTRTPPPEPLEPPAAPASEAPTSAIALEPSPAATPPRAEQQLGPRAPLVTHESPSLVFCVVVSALSLAADLGTKAWAKGRLEGYEPGSFVARRVELVRGYLDLVYARNYGGAWGLLQGEREAIRRPFFLLISALAVVFIVTLYRRLRPDQVALRWGLPLVLGGALGNLVDRVRYGYVIDFIDAFVTYGGRERHWPTFNIADVAICVGVGLMAVDMLVPSHRHAKLTHPPANAPAPAASEAPVPKNPTSVGDAPAAPATSGPAAPPATSGDLR